MAAATEAMDCDASDQQQNVTGEPSVHLAQQNNPSYDDVQQPQGTDQPVYMGIQQYVTVQTDQGYVQLTHDQYSQLLEQQGNFVERRGSTSSRNSSAGQRYVQDQPTATTSAMQDDPNNHQVSPAPNASVSQRQKTNENPFCRLVNFEIEKKIGRGQFSVVYRAKCKLNDMIVALKKVQVVY